MSEFTPFASLLGGGLIGLSAAVLLLVRGKVAGISGILGGVLSPKPQDTQWRVLFLAGLLTGGWLLAIVHPTAVGASVLDSPVALTLAGVLVGFGTRLGNGCTSGHGVCGVSRGSARSVVATLTFMAAGGITVYVMRGVLGGP